MVMYRVLKPSGSHSTITLMNLETKASLELGKITTRILDILNDGGADGIRDDLSSPWNLTVPKETWVTLAKESMRITKPDRKKIKEEPIPEEKPSEHTTKKPVDALALIFGIVD